MIKYNFIVFDLIKLCIVDSCVCILDCYVLVVSRLSLEIDS